MSDPFTVFEYPDGLRLQGEIDLAAASPLKACALGALPQWPQSVVLDLSEVTSFDSAGIGALVAIRNAATATGRSLTLANPSPSVRRLLRLTGMTEFFGMAADDQNPSGDS